MKPKQSEDLHKAELQRRAAKLLLEHQHAPHPTTYGVLVASDAPIRREARERLPHPMCSVSSTFFRNYGTTPGVTRFFERFGDYQRYDPETITDTLIAGGIPFTDRETLLGSVFVIAGAKTMLGVWPPYWHSVQGSVYHFRPECTKGSSIRRANRRSGMAGRPPCRECIRPWKQAFFHIPSSFRDEASPEEWADAQAWAKSGLESDD